MSLLCGVYLIHLLCLEINVLQILTIAVIGILVTSPIGAIGITVAGPQMLQQAQPGFVTVNAHTEQGKAERAAKQKPSLKITTV